MRRVRFDDLRIEEVPEPAPAEGELLIRASAIGVTLPVVRMARRDSPGLAAGSRVPVGSHVTGGSRVPAGSRVPGGSRVLGGEVAGTVIGLGPGVSGFAPGDQVVTLPFSGSYQDVVVASAAMTSPIPPDAAVTAVALVRSGHVALAALGTLAAGESVLITAAAGGVGHLAVQLARARGASRVVAAVGTPDKSDFVRKLGADEVVTYDGDWGQPVDLALDGAGGEVLPRALAAVRPGGRLVYFSSGGGTIAASDLLGGAKTVTGLAMRHFAARHPDQYAAHEPELWRLVETGQLAPAVHAELPLTEAARAHELLESRRNLGKVVLRP
ncbi:quinone oxidoreductase family protein [Actinoplanes sp. RD1]|uniref:quinone oxidoreductase family protein n=1 Tax=Actinoplanes sp. RD1 TaxID=3064538 RepID=UPI00274159FA|nr:zinc-binding dehydrogenase [Actinoplanes sp. RD1]